MIHVADSNAVYYYHYDGLGSVVALSNSSGDSCQSYQYSAYGQVVGSDPNFIANPYLFTGRRFDYETGLYYYRARYYNPYIGRFLQTDPGGYDDGINWYAYCGNNPVIMTDPSGLERNYADVYWHYHFLELDETDTKLKFAFIANGCVTWIWTYDTLSDWKIEWSKNFGDYIYQMPGWKLSGGNKDIFWELTAMTFLDRKIGTMIDGIEKSEAFKNEGVTLIPSNTRFDRYDYDSNTLYWSYRQETRGSDRNYWPAWRTQWNWFQVPAMANFAHELAHMAEDLGGSSYNETISETWAIQQENIMRYAIFTKVPYKTNIYPRVSLYPWDTKNEPSTASEAWINYWKHPIPYVP